MGLTQDCGEISRVVGSQRGNSMKAGPGSSANLVEVELLWHSCVCDVSQHQTGGSPVDAFISYMFEEGADIQTSCVAQCF